MQSCLYSSRLGQPFLQRYRFRNISVRTRLEPQPPITPLYRFSHDAAQDKENHNGPLMWRPQSLGTQSSEGSIIGARRLSSWEDPSIGVQSSGVSTHTNDSRNRYLKRAHHFSPPTALADYLSLRDPSRKQAYFKKIKLQLRPWAFPCILLYHLHVSSLKDTPWSSFDRYFHGEAEDHLGTRGMIMDDVKNWAWVLRGNGTDDRIDRFLFITSEKPQFLLLEILRGDILHVRTLRKVLVYVWDDILGKTSENDLKLLRGEEGSSPQAAGLFLEYSPALTQEDNSFGILISRLLYQARRIWPAAMVSVSRMAGPYFHSILDSNDNPESLDTRTLSRLSKLLNYILRLLALPASIGPLRYMVHNWSSQKVLLELAGDFEPPLVLDQSSYRAVVQVLAASKKTGRESRDATLRTRSWPPWRVEQDGMDAQRSLEENFSRVISAVARTQESGYRKDAHDETMRVFGGVEPDGTPTIHTRKLSKRRGRNPLHPSFDEDKHFALIWAARVESTRDVQEAWCAFTEYKRIGGKPHLAVYLAMFQKLDYHSALSGRKTRDNAPPGNGKEVLPIADDNFSDYYRLKLQAPTLDDLYEQMLESGVRPQGRCLEFLVSHARTTDLGLRYLRDGHVDQLAIEYLAGGSETKIPPEVLKKIPDYLFTTFIRLACRFAPRGKRVSSVQDSSPLEDSKRFGSALKEAEETNAHEMPPHVDLRPKSWTIVEMQPLKLKHLRFRNPLHHAAFLLRQRPVQFRPAWYAIFKALSEPGVLISRNLLGDPKNDYLSWRVLLAALSDFHKCGLELDPAGFVPICRGFEKFASAFTKSEAHEEAIIEGAAVIKSEFTKLSESQESSFYIPKLFHSVDGAVLHAYMRAMGLIENSNEILSTLKWMVENSQELEAIATETMNGHVLIRRSIIAVRVFLSGTESEHMASELVEQVDWWGGWPADEEVVEYLERGSWKALQYDVEDRQGDNDEADHGAER